MVTAASAVAERFVWEKTAMAPRVVLRTAKKVSKTLAQHNVPHALAGGLALGFHGYNRMTRDVDFVIPKSATKLVEQEFGKTTPISGHLSGFSVDIDGVPVDFLFVAKTVQQGDIASPESHAGLPVLGVDPLVAMKMGAGRIKDTLDVVELLKLGKVSVEEVTKRLSRRKDDLEQFLGLVTIAGLEQKGRPKESRRRLVGMLAKARPIR